MIAQSERLFDGRKNFPADDQIEHMLEAHFERFQVSRREVQVILRASARTS